MRRTTTITLLGLGLGIGLVAVAGCAPAGGVKPAAAPRASTAAKPAPQISAAEAATQAIAAVKQASAAYAEAYNSRDYAALAAQWTEKAELVEGGSRLEGREPIVNSIKAWLGRHPQATLAIEVTDVEPLATSLARVAGVMRFTRAAGEKPVATRFESLRVLDEGGWRLAESVVVPSHAAALDDLEWLVGSWQAADHDGGSVRMEFARGLDGHALVGRGTRQPKDGAAVESLQLIHADRATGLVRSWVFDSTGARAEGVLESDGTSFHQTLVGTPAEGAVGRVARWVQVISPAGADRFTLHAIDRSLDGVRVPDERPLHFKKSK
jgi:uncharacterized protein (TIGR02246 family)